MAELMKLDPAFEALLREVASEPESRLLRAPRGREVPRWLSLDAPASVGDMDLGRAERELVRVGREELAWLFRQAALRELFDGEKTTHEMMHGRAVDIEKRPVSRDELQEQVDRTGLTAIRELDAGGVLEAWLRQDPLGRPTAATLAAASMRIAPASQARALAGLDYTLRGVLQSAEVWLRASLHAGAATERAVPSWNNLALTHLRRGQVERALAASQQAIRIAPDNVVARGGAVVCAVLLENTTLLRFMARELEMVEHGESEAVRAYAETLRYQRRRGLLDVSPRASNLARECKGDFIAGGRILHELS
ncbi:MAG: tetratricopeptide repeat protein [Planctomycetes bacterium]|nr:tetratricopeptide repeat protein [Planctomycetota bacterium]